MRRYLAILGLFAVGAAHAQTFFDGFENYAAESGEYVSKGGWSLYPWNDEQLYSPLVRTARDGITPYEGTKMLEMRCPSVGGLTRVYTPLVFDGLKRPAIVSSFWINVAKQSFAGQTFSVVAEVGGSYVQGVYFDLSKGSVQINAATAKSLPFELGKWHKIDQRIDYVEKAVTSFFDGKVLGSNSYSVSSTLTQLSLSTANQAIAGYTRNEGAPGVFIDAYHAQVVPEARAIWTLALGCMLVGCGQRRFRR